MKYLLRLVICLPLLLLLFYLTSQVEDGLSHKNSQDDLSQKSNENPDIYAWLRIDGTAIDYPVAQHPTDDAYYLSHDLEHNDTYYGAIFTERVTTKTFDDIVTIIYGHAIQDGSMFGSLNRFSNQEVFNRYRTIEVDRLDKRYSYEIFAAYSYTDEHLYHTFQLGQAESAAQYIEQIGTFAREYGGYYRPIDFDVQKNKLLIVSTCDSQVDGMRYLVHAIRKENENENT
jgi:SrtB family sortase